MKKILVVVLLVGSTAFSQSKVNNYEYVIVPSKFSFSRTKDESKLNTLVKLLLENYGFKAFLDTDRQPDEIVDTNCNKLFADIENDNGFLTTKVRITLKDCKGKELFITEQGVSREKDWARAYNFAIRAAFKSFDDLHYKYTPPSMPVTATNDANVLSAQPMSNGYQLVDNSGKQIMKIFKTSSNQRFTAMRGDDNGELVLKNGEWFFEYYQNDQLVSEKTAIKF